VLALTFSLLGCAGELAPGDWGTFRYFGELRGEAPMRLLPPMSDRDGNVYVIWGDDDSPENTIYVGQALGGWTGGCEAHRGTQGVHGFVGRSDDRAWIWSGSALVSVDGGTGACREVLDDDPVTGTEISFLGVIPRVDETPSHRYLPALVQGAADRLPYFVTVDLDEGRYFDAIRFTPDGASEVAVVGTGADSANDRGVFVVSYESGGAIVSEAVYVTGDGASKAGTVTLPEALATGSIQGFIQFSDEGVGAGLLDDGRLLLLRNKNASIQAVSGMDPIGVQRWGGDIYLTGLADGVPVAAQIRSNGELASPRRWASSTNAATTLDRGITVRDERSDPAINAKWSTPVSAIGPAPLLSPWPIDVYTLSSTGWLVSGPGYSTGIDDYTAVAFAPLGVEL
jgi:hypothetical protein